MWISNTFLDLFNINRESTDALRTENAVLRAKNEILERELISTKVNSDWMRLKVNQLEIERSILLEKAYPGLQVPSLEIARTHNKIKDAFDLTSLFDHQGDDSPLPLS